MKPALSRWGLALSANTPPVTGASSATSQHAWSCVKHWLGTMVLPRVRHPETDDTACEVTHQAQHSPTRRQMRVCISFARVMRE